MIILNRNSINWNIGDTSFRRKHIISEYAFLLKGLKNLNELTEQWDDEIQVQYYNMIKKGLKENDNEIKDDEKAKRARTYTSALEKLGFCNKNRKVTIIGDQYIDLFYNICEIKKDDFEKILNLNDINLFYLRQVLKLEIKEKDKDEYFYPIIGLMMLINKYGYLDRDEFQLFTFVKNKVELEKYIKNIVEYRNDEINLDEFILKQSKNEINEESLKIYLKNKEISDEIICDLFKNRKSQQEHTNKIKKIISLFDKSADERTEENFKEIKEEILKSKYNTLKIRQKLSINRKSNYDEKIWNHPFFDESLTVRRKELYIYIEVQKNKNNSREYVDVLKRVLNRCGIFNCDSGIKFNSDIMNKALEVMELQVENQVPRTDFDSEISLIGIFGVNPIEDIEKHFKVSSEEMISSEHEYKEKQFISMIDNKFNREKIIELLELFKMNDEKSRETIHEMVTNNATIPTIYEYIVGIAWYYVSERKYNLLDSFNLIMDGSNLPETHAPGLRGDIEIEYDRTENYEKHNLLLELTLMDKNNQRRNELEPVIRHTYNMKSEFDNQYSLFISNKIDENVERIFSVCDNIPFETKNGRVDNIDIFALNTDELLIILRKNIKYKDIYNIVENSRKSKGNPFKIEKFREELKNK